MGYGYSTEGYDDMNNGFVIDDPMMGDGYGYGKSTAYGFGGGMGYPADMGYGYGASRSYNYDQGMWGPQNFYYNEWNNGFGDQEPNDHYPRHHNPKLAKEEDPQIKTSDVVKSLLDKFGKGSEQSIEVPDFGDCEA
jgi:hypothetical protein